MRKPRPADWLILVLSVLLGGWMVFDGARKLATGLYTGEDTIGLGPWAAIVSAVGLDPGSIAIIFILLGSVWLVNAAIIAIAGPGRYERVIAVSILTLFYLFPGTIVSITTLVAAYYERRRTQSL